MHRYPRIMHASRLLLSLAAFLLAALPAHAAAETLAVLEYSSGLFGKSADIPASAGSARSPFAGKRNAAWTLRAGDTLQQPRPTAERIIQFYQIDKKEPVLVATVVVRYARSARGWQPVYQLVPPPPVTWDGSKAIPVDTGLPGTVRVLQSSGSTADGYAATLSFGSHTGPIRIDLWEVQ